MRADRSIDFAKFALADRLGQPLSVIEAMTLDEFSGWQAFFVVEAEKQKE
jgi:hypothetical protein